MTGERKPEIIIVRPGPALWQGRLEFRGRTFRCALGKGGVTTVKREGDHKTPVGCFALRNLLYRPDKFTSPPQTALTARALTPGDGWCDDPADPRYNRPVPLPYPAGTERLWRDDELYDLILPLGYNDDPPVAGLGSAIFMHVAQADYSGTEGCVALARDDLVALLRDVEPSTLLEVRPLAG